MAKDQPEIIRLKKQLTTETNEAKKIQLKSEIKNIIDKAESRIRNAGRDIYYSVKDWDIETIYSKYTIGLEADENVLFIPDYQRDYKWEPKLASRFIESILLGFPIPYLYISDVVDEDPDKDGRAEIIDGSQRIRALVHFMNNDFVLEDLKEITELEGFTYSDFTSARKRRFDRISLRFVELIGEVSESNRRDLFERINSGAKSLESMEVRHGSEDAAKKFYTDVLEPLATSALFSELAPLSDKKKANKDHLELVLRYFAYAHDIENYRGTVRPFLDSYLEKVTQETEEQNPEEFSVYLDEFNEVLNFINEHFAGMGFKKTLNSGTTTRARYEAIAIGVRFALNEDPTLTPAIPVSDWILSEEFQTVVGADSANNTTQLENRINFVKNKLLTGD